MQESTQALRDESVPAPDLATIVPEVNTQELV
jgi:hypothetical protein